MNNVHSRTRVGKSHLDYATIQGCIISRHAAGTQVVRRADRRVAAAQQTTQPVRDSYLFKISELHHTRISHPTAVLPNSRLSGRTRKDLF